MECAQGKEASWIKGRPVLPAGLDSGTPIEWVSRNPAVLLVPVPLLLLSVAGTLRRVAEGILTHLREGQQFRAAAEMVKLVQEHPNVRVVIVQHERGSTMKIEPAGDGHAASLANKVIPLPARRVLDDHT